MAVHLEGVHSVFTPKTKRRPEKGEATATSLNRNTPKQKVSCGASRCTTPSVLRRRIPAQCLRCNARTLSSRGPANAPLHVLGKPGPHRPGPTPLPNPTVSSTPCFRDSPAPLAPKCLLSSQPLQPDPPILLPSQRGRPCRTGLPRRRRGRWPSGPAPATPLAASTPDAPTTTPLPAASRSPRRPAPLPPAGTHIFRCRSNSAFFSSSSRFCFSSRLLRLLTVRPKMSMRSGGDDARSRSRSRRDTAVLVERERERDSRRRFRLLSRDLERFRTRSLSRDRDRDRLRFLLCLLLLVCLERDELRLRDRPILPGDAVTNRWFRAPHVPGYPRLRLRTRAGRPVETGERAAVTQMTSCRSLRSTAATKAA